MKKFLLLLFLMTLFPNIAPADHLQNEIIRISECGLKVFQKESRVTNRREIYTNMVQPVTFDISTDLPDDCYEVVKAYIWWSMADTLTEIQDPVAYITTPTGTTHVVEAVLAGQAKDRGWFREQNSKVFRVDVSDYVFDKGEYKIRVSSDLYETDGITLLVAYKDYKASPMFMGHLIIDDGNVTSTTNAPHLNIDVDHFNLPDAPTFTQAFFVASDIEVMWNIKDTVKDVEVQINGDPYYFGRDFWNSELITIPNIPASQNILNFRIINDFTIHLYGDLVTMAVSGLYCRTPGYDCPENLEMNLETHDYAVCPGTEITFEPSGKADSYEWWSIPAGFSSTEQSPTITANTTMDYVVKGVIGNNCLIGYDTIHVEVFDPPVANAGDDLTVCRGNTTIIGTESTGGTEPYQYHWEPSTGLSADDIATPEAGPDNRTTYYLTVTDANGCVDYDTITVDVVDGQKPVITYETLNTCPCRDITLDAGEGFESYLWSTGDTTQIIYISEPGEYYVIATNANGCEAQSDIVIVTVNELRTDVRFSTLSASIGDTVSIPLQLTRDDNLDECEVSDFYCEYRYNPTMLVPLYKQDNINGDYAYGTLEGSRQTNNNTLATLQFIVVWGADETTDIDILDFRWVFEDNPDCFVEADSLIDGQFTTEDFCNSGGEPRRFYYLEGGPKISIKPNPAISDATIEYELTADGYTDIFIMDMLGRKIEKIYSGMARKGTFEEKIDLQSLTNGVYFIVINAPNGTATRNLEVGK